MLTAILVTHGTSQVLLGNPPYHPLSETAILAPRLI